ncbi:MAG TPA: multiheme c-type cytochrome [Polyangiaceae bacterium]|nr:multiheme c-type cytochrome [Polyangiaceae bacterium]
MRRGRGGGGTIVLGAAVVCAACAGAVEGPEGSGPGGPAAGPGPRLPEAAAGALAPSRVELAGAPSGKEIADVERCEGCHAETVEAWRASAHANASFSNPIYRASVERFRREAGNEKSNFCAGCHDVALLVDGAMAGEIAPEDPRAHAGVTCLVCHGIDAVRADGNGSYRLRAFDPAIPTTDEPAAIAAHRARVATPALRDASLCGACHRAFLHEDTGNPFHFPGQDDATAFRGSAYAGSLSARVDPGVEPKRCQDCHQAREPATRDVVAERRDGRLASHRFLGGHTFLASLRGDAPQVERTREFLRGTASVDVAALVREDGARVVPPDGAPIAPGERVRLDVVLRNLGTGHRFPGGVMDVQDTWLEVTVDDAAGRRLAEAGARQAEGGADPSAHRLLAFTIDERGQPLWEHQTERFRAVAWNHTLGAREAAAVSYAFEVPDTLPPGSLPLVVSVRLLHRSRNLELQRVACADLADERGRRFQAAAPGPAPADPCAPQPIVEIGRASVELGAGASASAGRAAWSRAYELGLAMLRAPQEYLGEAEASLEAAWGELGAPEGEPRAMLASALAEASARRGRLAEALAWAERAEAGAPGHPAIARVRGEAYAQVWRWGEASAWYGRAAEASPDDPAAWSRFAVAAAAAGREGEARSASARCLSLLPREPDCLRVQALAFGPGAAWDAFATFRLPDGASGWRGRCSAGVPGCALERVPVHTHPLLPPAGGAPRGAKGPPG